MFSLQSAGPIELPSKAPSGWWQPSHQPGDLSTWMEKDRCSWNEAVDVIQHLEPGHLGYTVRPVAKTTGQHLEWIIFYHLVEEGVNVVPLFPGVLPVPPVLMAVWQQKKHGLLTRGQLGRGLLAWGHAICLMACQCVCQNSSQRTLVLKANFPLSARPQQLGVSGFCEASLLPYKNISSGFAQVSIQSLVCGNYFHSIAQIPDWPCPAPAAALSAHNTLLIMANGEGGISERDTL